MFSGVSVCLYVLIHLENKKENEHVKGGGYSSLSLNYYYYYDFYRYYYHILCHIIDGTSAITTPSAIIHRSEKTKPCSFPKAGRAKHYVAAKGQLSTEDSRSYVCYTDRLGGIVALDRHKS